MHQNSPWGEELACKTLQAWASHIASLMPTSARVLQCTDLSRLPSQQLQKASICLLHLHRANGASRAGLTFWATLCQACAPYAPAVEHSMSPASRLNI